jgi:hypothetical protein
MNINDMYLICQFAINKSQNGYLSPAQFNTIINQGQTSYQTYLLGEFQQYQYGRPQVRIGYSQNQNIRQRLSPLITDITLTINGTTGKSPYPADYVQVDALRTTAFKRIRYAQQDSLYSYYNSTIDPIAANPIYLIEPAGFQFYPLSLGTAILTYVKNAPTMTWAYTLDSNGRPVYNPGASVQPVWDDVDLLEIIARALKLVGLNLQMGQIQQYANQITQQGQ